MIVILAPAVPARFLDLDSHRRSRWRSFPIGPAASLHPVRHRRRRSRPPPCRSARSRPGRHRHRPQPATPHRRSRPVRAHLQTPAADSAPRRPVASARQTSSRPLNHTVSGRVAGGRTACRPSPRRPRADSTGEHLSRPSATAFYSPRDARTPGTRSRSGQRRPSPSVVQAVGRPSRTRTGTLRRPWVVPARRRPSMRPSTSST